MASNSLFSIKLPYRVVTALRKRIATYYAFYSQKCSSKRPVTVNGFQGITRTRRVITASIWEKNTAYLLIRFYQY